MPECAGKVFLFYDIIIKEIYINKQTKNINQ